MADPAPSPSPLARTLGVGGALFLTLSATTPASSVFVMVPEMLAEAGSGALWAMLLAALVCVATGYVYAELSSAWPVAGGEYVMVARTLGPLAGFVILGVNVVNNLLFPAVVGLGLSDVLGAVVPGLPPVPVAVAMVAACTLVGILNVRVTAWLTGLFLGVELAALLVLAVLGLLAPERSLGGLLLHPLAPGPHGLIPASAASIGIATTVAVLALNGYGMAVYFGEELTDAPRRIARIVLAALAITLAVEVAPLAAVLAGAPDLGGLFAARDPFGGFVALRGGPVLARWVAVGVAVAIVNAAIAAILAFARFFYSTGRDRVWGARLDAWTTALHPRFASPWIATLIVGGTGIAACFLPLDLLLVLSGAGLIVTYMAICLAAIVGRRTGATAHAPYRMPLFPLAPAATLAMLAYVIWTNWQDPAIGRPGLIATGAQMLASAAYYRLVLKPRGTWITRDPAG